MPGRPRQLQRIQRWRALDRGARDGERLSDRGNRRLPRVRSAAARSGARRPAARRVARAAATPSQHGPRIRSIGPLALTVTAAIVFIIANTTPLMGLSAVGRHASTTIVGGALEMWQDGRARSRP